jgi:hypothetical protein
MMLFVTAMIVVFMGMIRSATFFSRLVIIIVVVVVVTTNYHE